MTTSKLLGTALLATLLAGCGGSSTNDPSATGGSSGSGGSGATAGAGGSSGSGAAAGTGGGSGSGGAGDCSDFADDVPPPTTWTIRLENHTAQPIYVTGDNGCGPTEAYEIQGPNGAVALHPGGCGNTCEMLQHQPDYCTGACMMPPTIFILPGGHYDASFSGTTYQSVIMPLECHHDPESAAPSCDQRVILPAGAYVATSTASTSIACSDASTCSCKADASGSCQIPYAGAPAGEILNAAGSFEFPAESLVSVVFD